MKALKREAKPILASSLIPSFHLTHCWAKNKWLNFFHPISFLSKLCATNKQNPKKKSFADFHLLPDLFFFLSFNLLRFIPYLFFLPFHIFECCFVISINHDAKKMYVYIFIVCIRQKLKNVIVNFYARECSFKLATRENEYIFVCLYISLSHKRVSEWTRKK